MRQWRHIALGAASALLLAPGSARGESIYRWVDRDGGVHVTNIQPGVKRSAARRMADPTFKGYQPGPEAPLEFAPHPNTAKYDPYIKEACEKYHIPPALVRAVMNVESNFDPRAMSDKGAMGLMQLMPTTGS